MRASDPKKLAFFTGRDQSQSLTSLWATQLRHAQLGGAWRLLLGQHGGRRPVHGRRQLLGVRRAGLGACTRYFLLFGVAEDHDSNPIKLGLSRLKARGAKIVAINPVRTGYAAIADEWIGIRPGTDGLFILALVHELLRARPGRPRLPGPPDRRRLAGRRRSRHGRGRPLRPRRAGPPPRPSTRPPASVLPAEAAARARLGAAPRCPTGAARDAGVRICWRSATATPLRAGSRGRPLRHRRPRRSGGSPPRSAHVAFERPVFDRAALDRHRGRAPRRLPRPAGGDARHARHLGPCQRLPDLPRAAPAAAPDRQRRCARAAGATRRPIPRPCPPGPRPFGRPDEIAPGKPLPGSPLGFPRGPEDLLLDADGSAGADRQGVQLGRAARGARHAADGDRQRLARRPLPGRGAVPVHGQHGLELGA